MKCVKLSDSNGDRPCEQIFFGNVKIFMGAITYKVVRVSSVVHSNYMTLDALSIQRQVPAQKSTVGVAKTDRVYAAVTLASKLRSPKNSVGDSLQWLSDFVV